MPRPPKMRSVRHDPSVVYFKPAGIPMRDLEEVALGLDELEALRLADLEGLSQEQVGEMMNVSRATAGRIIAEARRKTAAALVHGWAIRVEGGHVETVGPDDREDQGSESGSEPGRRGRRGCRRGGRV
ncbi:DUF134 domain-containing protein [bacterium]|nr:DUF134 domain-containing protein [bacterium]